MVDAKAFVDNRASYRPYYERDLKLFKPESADHLNMTEDEYIICTDVVRGYCLTQRKWGSFYISFLSDIKWNETAFDSFIFDARYKKIILSLVEAHGKSAAEFDDIIKGKGLGMVFLLHGEPGVGKTLTAGKNLEVLYILISIQEPAFKNSGRRCIC